MVPCSVITFCSDFGTREHYVGAVKGAILSRFPKAQVIDLTHQITPHHIEEGSFLLACAYSYFPKGTVHLAVVDPGVGSERKGIAVETEDYYFVAPDNGLLSLVLERERLVRAVSLTNPEFFRPVVSPTFHARDIFGPVAASLAAGVDLSHLGEPLPRPQLLPHPPPRQVGDEELEGRVLHVDRFGNLITNLRPEQVSGLLASGSLSFRLGGTWVVRKCRYYAEAPPGEPFFLVGSSGYYEISLRGESAAERLGVKAGDPVRVRLEAGG